MNDLAPGKKIDVRIDRLVLDIPGLDATQAHALARDVGERLARSGLSGTHPVIGVTLGPVDSSQSDLAERITAVLMGRLV